MILEAIRSRDAEKAAEVMRAHFLELHDVLEKTGFSFLPMAEGIRLCLPEGSSLHLSHYINSKEHDQ